VPAPFRLILPFTCIKDNERTIESSMTPKYVYLFAEGNKDMRNELGGKGANLSEMTNMGIPVPPGFTITTEVCTYYYAHGRTYPPTLEQEVADALAQVEAQMGRKFGDPEDPLLFSVRSGARQSMPGMMETVLNVGLTTQTIPGLIQRSGNPRFVYDAYRRLITMYADVVMEKAAGIEPAEGQGIRAQLERELERVKQEKEYRQDTDLTAEDLEKLCEVYKAKVREVLGQPFPDDPREQLWGSIGAVFQSWNGKRAVDYRRIEGIPDEWGTAVNVQAMVFGNLGDHSATGVAFTRNPATGENVFYGEWLPNAQGEDVVAGIRTPNPINEYGKNKRNQHLPSLEVAMPTLYQQLDGIQKKLERHFRDMQDIEFTIEEGKLYMLQTRVGKRNGVAAVRMAVEMGREGLISREEALLRVKPEQLEELLHPMVDPEAEKAASVLAEGLPAGPGGAVGKIVLTADEAEAQAKATQKRIEEARTAEEKENAKKEGRIILVRNETSPEDVHGMHAAEAILTAKGGMTSHAALVARGWGKCCIVGCGALNIDVGQGTVSVDGRVLRAGDWITLNGTQGKVYEGQLPLLPADPEGNEFYQQLMTWADEVRALGVRTNADTPEDAAQARAYGAEGIGLCRTEHMFFSSEERLLAMRKMIVAETAEDRRAALATLLPIQKQDFIGILKVMEGLPVTIRLLDPPLHEFVALNEEQTRKLAAELEVAAETLEARIKQLHELNPMLGHRGCRLGIAYPEITEMQARAICEAAAELTRQGVEVQPEIMVPLVGTVAELKHQEKIIRRVAEEVQQATGTEFHYSVGTMIEVPRACLVAEEIAKVAEFFSFGTNDLTQMAFGYSRDDVGSFLPGYLENKILPADPFQTLDQTGVGQLVEMGVQRGRKARPDLKIGICGEHGGDPDSVKFCHRTGLNYVSCSPFRVPVARLAAAQAVLEEKKIEGTRVD